MPRMSRDFHHFLRILDTSDTSCHLRSFLGPRVVSNQKNDNWTIMCESKTSSNPIALKLMVDISFLDHWLSTHHSNIDHATWAHISGAPFNQCLVVYVFLQRTSLYRLIWQMLSLVHMIEETHLFRNLEEWSLSHQHLLVLSLVKWWTLVSELASIVHFPRILQCLLVNLCCTFSSQASRVWGFWHQSDLNLCQIWWLGHISKSYNIGIYMTR